MKTKTIKKVLYGKLNEWIDTLPEHLQSNVKRDVIVTGGCIASMLLKEKVSDYDVYFKTRQTTIDVAKHYVDSFVKTRKTTFESGREVDITVDSSGTRLDANRVRIVVKSAGIAGEIDQNNYKYFEGDPTADDAESFVDRAHDLVDNEGKPKYRPIFLSSNAITLSQGVQVILRFYGTPEDIHGNFDYVHCMCYYDLKNNHLELKKEALQCLLSKELVYVGSKYPICSVFRIRKFMNRGWSINAGQILKIAFQINDLDLSDMAVLEDQLTGVDAAYFQEMIRLLEQKSDEEGFQSPEHMRSYLLEIIDRMF